MNNFLSHLVTLTLLFTTHSHADNFYQPCEQIKMLPMHASEEKYRSVVENLSQHGLSPCTCINHFMQQREQKTRRALEREFNIPKALWKLEDTILQADQPNNTTIIYHPQFPDYAKPPVESRLKQSSFRGTLHVRPFDGNTIKGGYSPAALESSLISSGKYCCLSLDLNYFNSYPHTYEGTLLHEITHASKQHGIKQNFLENLSHTQYPGLPESNAYIAWVRTQEAQADRIPAACGSCADAQAMQSVFIEEKKQSNETIYRSLVRNTQRAITHYIGIRETQPLIDVHPPLYKRLLWATRIAGLKKAEENLKKEKQLKMEQSLNYYAMHAYTSMNNFE